jgi:hypothetical protein
MITTNKQLTATRYTLTISGGEGGLRDLISSVSNFGHPGVRSTAAKQSARKIVVPQPGSSVEFDPATFTVLLDSEMKNYEAIYTWLFENAVKEPGVTRDITLTIYDTTDNPQKQIRYLNAFPTDIGTFQFTSTDANDTIITCDITFAYSHFELVNA